MEQWKKAAQERLVAFWQKNKRKIIVMAVAAGVAQLAKYGVAPDAAWIDLVTELLITAA